MTIDFFICHLFIMCGKRIVMKKIVNFIAEVKGELKKVGWSNKKELTYSTGVVTIISFFLALIIAIADWFLSHIIRIIIR
ncbi:preprotein translocase subunit SecE [bacterium Unc6]|nr:preprotein translocase subunit SecE [bacterium Unc6]